MSSKVDFFFNKEHIMLFILPFYAFFCTKEINIIMNKIVIFASGSGTNTENIIKYFKNKKTAKVITVFTNNPNAGVIERAQNFNIATEIFPKTLFLEPIFLQKLINLQPDLIVLAGFLLKLPVSIVETFPNKIINIHPALLPKYGGKGMYGMNVHRAVVENNENETGITIHYVNENYDEGAIIFQKKVTVLVTDTPEIVAEKIYEIEQKYFPEIIEKLLASNL